MNHSPCALPPRRGDYGFDAPYVAAMLGGGSLLAFALGAVDIAGGSLSAGLPFFAAGVLLALCTASFVYTTRAGKFAVWADLLCSLPLRGDEHVLDIGCGRGAILLMAAQLVPEGKGVGIDLWQSSDQSGNSIDVARRNSEIEGVASRVELKTADMRSLLFEDRSFDIVVTSLAVHNIKERDGRDRAVDEAVRVLRPGGTLLIADFRFADQYAGRLRELGMEDVAQRMLGPRFWYGGPWAATKLVTGTKPGAFKDQPN